MELNESRLSSKSAAIVLALVTVVMAFSISGLGGGAVKSLISESTLDSEVNSLLSATKSDTEATAINTVDLQKGLQAYYRFDDPKVSRGYSLEFDGSDDYVRTSKVNLGSSFGISFWMKPKRLYDWGDPLSAGTSDFWLTFVTYNDGHMYYNVGDGSSWGNAIDPGAGTFREGKWYHIVGNYNGTHTELYIDGKFVGRAKNSGYSFNKVFNIGTRDGVDYYFDGAIDDVRIYNNSISSSEIQNLYDGKHISRKGLVLYQDFDEGSDDCDLTSNTACLEDDSGNGNNGTPQNFDNNEFNTGSGWLNETPLNRPSIKDYSSNSHTGRFYGGNNGELKKFNFSESMSEWNNGTVAKHSLRFDGTDDLVKNESPENLPTDHEPRTIAGWFKPTDSTKGGIFGYGTDVCNRGFQFYSPNGLGSEVQLDVWCTSEGGLSPRVISNVQEKWYHLVGTYNGTHLATYRNGEQIDTAKFDKSNVNTSDNRIVAGAELDQNDWFQGKVDDFRIYERALSKSEAESLYQGESVTTDLVSRWNFESGDREKAYDTSSLGREGVLGTSGIGFEDESFEDSADLNIDDEFVISSWVNPEMLGTKSNPAESCSSIKESGYDEGSGKYWIESDDGSEKATKVYCDMETDGGGWTRVVDKDYQNKDNCPTEWSSKKSGQVCGPDESGADYVSYDNLDGLNYDEVYVKSKLWEEGSNDAFDSCDGSTGGGGCTSGKEVSYDQVLADGVSLYSGTDHIHTYAFGHDQSSSYGCPRYGGPNPPDGWERGDNKEYNCVNTNGDDGWSNNFGTHQTMSDVKLTSSDFYVTLSSDQSVSNEQQGVEDLEIYVRDSGEAETVSGGDDSYYIHDNGTLYRVHAFTETGKSSFSIQGGLTEVDLLLVGGGGGGGGRSGGGGGAGGLVFIPDYKLSQGNYEVKVGAGGGGGPADGEPTYSGENSSFANLTALGGGAGATDNDKTGKTGGSGGGGKYGNDGSTGLQPTLEGKSGTYGYGHKGGYGTQDSWKAGGGGGAGQDGINGVDDDPGDGGNGIYLATVNSKTYNLNDMYGDVGEVINGESWFAGGGGGGSHESESYGPYKDSGKGEAGKGGGGHGGIPVGTNACGEDAMANTGGGGGGGSTNGGSGCGGGDGGSGIILVRYPVETVASLNDGTYSLGYVDGGLRGYVERESVYADINTGKWQNVVLNFNGSSQKLYVDGEKRVSSKFNGKISSYSKNVVIGKNFNGKIDETKIYNRSLSQKEIQRLAFK